MICITSLFTKGKLATPKVLIIVADEYLKARKHFDINYFPNILLYKDILALLEGINVEKNHRFPFSGQSQRPFQSRC
jgi:hypothetical protein